jgi:hypothetical protein
MNNFEVQWLYRLQNSIVYGQKAKSEIAMVYKDYINLKIKNFEVTADITIEINKK